MILKPKLVISWQFHHEIWLKIFISTCYTSAIYQKWSILGFSGGKMDMTSTQLGITCTNEKLFKYSVIFRCKIITMMCVSTKNHLKCSNLGWMRLCLCLDWPKKQSVLQNRSRNPSLICLPIIILLISVYTMIIKFLKMIAITSINTYLDQKLSVLKYSPGH